MARKKPVKPVAKTDSYEEEEQQQEEEDSSSTEMAEKVDVQQSPQIQPQNDDNSSSSDDETKKHPKKAIKYSSEEEDEKQQKQPSSVIQKSEKSVSKPKKEKQNSVSSKKPKKEKEEGMSSKKKKQATGLFQRVFSGKDEIKILKGLIDYKVEKGVDPPMLDLDEFYGFIKNSLECECDKRQMADKLKRLKKRLENDNKKLTNLHEHEIFDLSKKICEKQVQSVGDDEVNVKNNEVVVVNSSNGRGAWRSRSVSSYLKWKGVDTVEYDDGKDRLRKKGMELMAS